MASNNYKTRITALGMDISIKRLDDAGVRRAHMSEPFAAFISEEEALRDGETRDIEEPSLGDEEEDAFEEVSEEELLEIFGTGGAQFSEEEFAYISRLVSITRVMDMLSEVIVGFWDRVIPVMVDLSVEDRISAIADMYVAIVSINPSLNPGFYEYIKPQDVMDAVLVDAVKFLPYRSIDEMYLNHMTRSSGLVFMRSVEHDRCVNDALEEHSPEDVADQVVHPETDPVQIDEQAALKLGDNLSKRVIGQEEAIDHISSISKRMAVGFRDTSRPASVMLFSGPTGVGKTLMAKETANLLFGDEEKYGRIDCSQLSERHHVAKLLGAPPGYLGYPDRSEKGKDKDPSLAYTQGNKLKDGGILLLDEVEKAHPEIWDQFLTAFDEGYLKTSAGHYIDLRNTMIIMTTNLGSREFAAKRDSNPIGFNAEACDITNDDTDAIRSVTMKALEEYMAPEIIGRITEVVPFRDLTEDEMRKIVDLEWVKTGKFISEKCSCDIVLRDSLKNHIASCSAGRGLGARLVSRLLDLYVVDPLVEHYIAGNSDYFNDPESLISLDLGEDEKLAVEVIGAGTTQAYDVKNTSLTL